MARWLILGWALLVLGGLAGAWAWRRSADLDDRIDACLSAQRTALVQRAAGTLGTGGLVARACAPLYREEACRSAHEHADEVAIEARAYSIYRACAGAYCGKLSPRPAACDQPTPPAEERLRLWHDLRVAILRHDLGDAATERLLRPPP